MISLKKTVAFSTVSKEEQLKNASCAIATDVPEI